jgi:sigma-B regulation protein RsbU (phosphoserine phosphatase)
MFFQLIGNVAIIIVAAYLFTRSKLFERVIEASRISWRDRLALIAIFGLFSVYGAVNHIEFFGALLNVRDFGPLVGGMIGGPIVCIVSGFIGALHRMFLGGPTEIPCSVATIVAGLVGGGIYILHKGDLPKVWIGAIAAIAVETTHHGLTIVYLWLQGDSHHGLTLFSNLYLPMLIANATGVSVFLFMLRNTIRERKNQILKHSYESELRIAYDIQISMLPPIEKSYKDIQNIDIYAKMIPAKEVGGDLYDFFLIDDRHLCFFIGDVSDKGVSAALFMAKSITLIRSIAKNLPSNDVIFTPANILQKANNELCRNNKNCMFVTLFISIINVMDGSFRYSSAGHLPPIILSETNDLSELNMINARPLGIIADSKYVDSKFTLRPYETIFCYTDGITEATNVYDTMFGSKNLFEQIAMISDNNPENITESVISKVKEFTGINDQSDDITAIAIRFIDNRRKEIK